MPAGRSGDTGGEGGGATTREGNRGGKQQNGEGVVLTYSAGPQTDTRAVDAVRVGGAHDEDRTKRTVSTR